MDEKIMRIMEKANISYEEAKAVLESANGDMLDAILILEREGKVNAPENSIHTTAYGEQREPAKGIADKQEATLHDSLKRLFATFVRFVKATDFVVKREERTILSVPTVVFLIILLLLFEVLLPVMLISLFFDVRYSFTGAGNVGKPNDLLDKAGNAANAVKNEFAR